MRKIKMAGRFTKEEYMLLINTMKDYGALYDPHHQNYKSKATREKSWKSIADIVGKSVTECRMKWRNLRDHYMRGHLKNGNRHTQWTFYEPLSFLEKIKTQSQNGSLTSTENYHHNEDEDDDVFSETEDNTSTMTKRRKTSNDIDDRLVVQTVPVIVEESNSDDDDDHGDIDTFMKNIAERLKRLPQQSVDLAKMNILAQVTELELEQSWTLSASEPYS